MEEPAKRTLIMDGISVALLAQNAILLSKPLQALASGNADYLMHLLVILFALINFINIAVDWILTKKVGNSYSYSLMFWDVIIAGIYFTFTQTAIGIYDQGISMSAILIIIALNYMILNMLYFCWNVKGAKQVINEKMATITMSLNAVFFTLNLFVLLGSILEIFLLSIIPFFVFFAASILLVSYHLKNTFEDNRKENDAK